MTNKPMDQSAVRAAVRTLARRSSAPLWNRLWPRVEDIASRIAEHRVGVVAAELRSELARLSDELRRDIEALRDEVAGTRPLAGRIDWVDNVLARMGPHVAAVDERVGSLERGRVDADSPDEAERERARSLVDEVRAEHARVRARLTAIAQYEERITRLEKLVDTQRNK